MGPSTEGFQSVVLLVRQMPIKSHGTIHLRLTVSRASYTSTHDGPESRVDLVAKERRGDAKNELLGASLLNGDKASCLWVLLRDREPDRRLGTHGAAK
jgi:hypothetical protein